MTASDRAGIAEGVPRAKLDGWERTSPLLHLTQDVLFGLPPDLRHQAAEAPPHLWSGRIVVSETEAPNMLADLV